MANDVLFNKISLKKGGGMSNNLKRFGLLSLILLSLASLLLVYGCGSDDDNDPFSRTEQVDVPIGSFDLSGASGQGSLSVHAALAGNPVCGRVSMDDLLSDVSAWLELNGIFDNVDIEQIRYRITRNDSTAEITGILKMEDPFTHDYAPVGSVSIPEGATTDWATLPFVPGGSSILNHYLDNLGDSFNFCAEGSPDTNELSLTIEIELDVNVTVSIL